MKHQWDERFYGIELWSKMSRRFWNDDEMNEYQ